MSLQHQVRISYRNLLSVIRIVFENDVQLQQSAKHEIYMNYIKHKSIQDTDKIKKLLQDSEDAYSYLKHNIIQIKKKSADTDVYTAKLRAEHTTKDTKPPDEII